MPFEAVGYLDSISNEAQFVPVTSRSIAQYSRIGFLPSVSVNYAIVANGGIILKDGKPDTDWSKFVSQTVLSQSEPLAKVLEYWTKKVAINNSGIKKVSTTDDVFVYFAGSETEIHPGILEDMKEKSSLWNYEVSFQSRKAYFVPKALTKVMALNEVRDRLGVNYLIAAGDSILDKPILEVADKAYRPSHGELETLGYTASNLVTVPNERISASTAILSDVLQTIRSLN